MYITDGRHEIFIYNGVKDIYFNKVAIEHYKVACDKIEARLITQEIPQNWNRYCHNVFKRYLK